MVPACLIVAALVQVSCQPVLHQLCSTQMVLQPSFCSRVVAEQILEGHPFVITQLLLLLRR